MRRTIQRLSFTVAAMALATATAAHAQDAEGGDDGTDIEEDGSLARNAGGPGNAESEDKPMIVVSAQRRDEDLQDVPVTVTVFGADEIEDARIQQIDDIATRTVGLSFDAFPATQPRLFIRGIGSSDRGAAGDPSAAVFLDEVYLGRPAAVAFDAFDIERIEVLKGPQGTLYGRNVVGGAVNVITRKPDLYDTGGQAEFTYGNFDRLDLAGFVNLPFAGNTGAVRVSGAYRSHDGYVRNTFLGTDVEDQDTLSGRFQFYAEPSDNFRALFTVYGTRDRATGPANRPLETDPPGSPLYTVNLDPDTTTGSIPGNQDRDTYGVRAELGLDLPFATLTFLGSYRELQYNAGYDFDGGNATNNIIQISGSNDEEAELSSQELRLSSLPGGGVNWVVGFYHYNQQVERSDVFNLDAPPVAPIPLTEIYEQDASLDSVAVFADVSVAVSDTITLIAGGRYSRDDKTYSITNANSDAPLRGDEFFDVTAEASFDDFTFRGGIDFQPSDDHLFYAMVSRGFKAGGFQDTPANAAEAATPFAPETAIQYEIGQKSSLFGGTVIWNNTLYYLDYTDLQTRRTLPDGSIVTDNAGQASIKGYETQLTVRPFAGFVLSGSYAYTDATFDVYEEDGVDLAGNRLSRTPLHKLTVSPSYTYAFPGGMELTLAADYRYASEIFDDNSNQPPEIREPTHFVDARIVLDNIADRFRLSLWGKNLTDERTRTFQSLFLGGNFGAFSPPRTYGATVGVDF